MPYKIDVRWHNGGRLSDRTITPDATQAEAAFRALLRRNDLVGQPCAARLVSPITLRAIYFSRFDRDIGQGRIHPDAPLDLMREDDGTGVTTAWRPPRASVDYDGGTFSDLLRAWEASRGWPGAEVARRLRVPYLTYRNWLTGRTGCPAEPSMRLLIKLIDERDAQ